MRRGLTRVWSVALVLQVPAVATGALGVLLALVVLPLGPVRVPGQADVRTIVWPLVPALASLAVPIAAEIRSWSWTWAVARSPVTVRATALSVVVARSAALVAIVGVDRLVVARSLLLFDGLALGACVIRGGATWTAAFAGPVVVWMIGVEAPSTVRWWAVPLLPPHHLGAWAVAVGVWTAAVVAFVWWPVRRPGACS